MTEQLTPAEIEYLKQQGFTDDEFEFAVNDVIETREIESFYANFFNQIIMSASCIRAEKRTQV